MEEVSLYLPGAIMIAIVIVAYVYYCVCTEAEDK